MPIKMRIDPKSNATIRPKISTPNSVQKEKPKKPDAIKTTGNRKPYEKRTEWFAVRKITIKADNISQLKKKIENVKSKEKLIFIQGRLAEKIETLSFI